MKIFARILIVVFMLSVVPVNTVAKTQSVGNVEKVCYKKKKTKKSKRCQCWVCDCKRKAAKGSRYCRSCQLICIHGTPPM